jgi:hypothetical protein
MPAGKDRRPNGLGGAARGFIDMLASTLRGSVKSAMGAPGDLESLLRGTTDTALPTTERVDKFLPPVNKGQDANAMEDIGGFLPTPGGLAESALNTAAFLPAAGKMFLQDKTLSDYLRKAVPMADNMRAKGAGDQDIFDKIGLIPNFARLESDTNIRAPKWYFETPQGEVSRNIPVGSEVNIKDIYDDPLLYRLVPELEKTRIALGNAKSIIPIRGLSRGHYDSKNKQIAIRDSEVANAPSSSFTGLFNHELDHNIQDVLGQKDRTGYASHPIDHSAIPFLDELADTMVVTKPDIAKLLRYGVGTSNIVKDPNAFSRHNWDISAGEIGAEQAKARSIGATDPALLPAFPQSLIMPDSIQTALSRQLYSFGRPDSVGFRRTGGIYDNPDIAQALIKQFRDR